MLRTLTALPEVRWAALATALFVLGALALVLDAPTGLSWTLLLACYAAGGWEPALAGLRALREKILDVDLLMIVAAIGAAAIGQVLDGGLLIVIFATSGALEAFATRRTADAVRGLTGLAPEQATLLAGERRVDVAELSPGDVVLVRPGQRLPADGVVVFGASPVEQSSITGEPLAVDKVCGDEVFAGTGNGAGVLHVRVTRDASDSVVSRIAALVEAASATKARTQVFIDRVEQSYAVVVVVATLLVFGVPMLVGADLDAALLRAMTFMIVASPCALVLATMPPLLATIANASRHGVLVTSSVVVERLGCADSVVLDKTGTLTDGVPQVRSVDPVDGVSAPELLRWAASAEVGSEHPLGRAVVAHARAAGIPLPRAEQFLAAAGRGVEADVDGRRVEVLSPRAASAQDDPAVLAVEGAGATAVVVRVDGVAAGVLGLGDRLRPEAAAAVAALNRQHPGGVALLTGDNPRAAAALAAEVGITQVHAQLLPQEKVEHVRRRQDGGHRVLVVGDGVNDAPMIATADAGIALGGIGSDLAVRAADAVVVRDDLAAVPAVVELSRRAHRVVVANLVIASVVIVGLVTWDLVGHLPLPLGVAGHEGSTVLVALNGLRLLRSAAWPTEVGHLP
ncbi:MAG: heavy metal translocating P-type ATPase [Janthinobacterium lividum]